MSPLYRFWWRCLMDLRPLVRYGAERFPKAAPSAIRIRTLAHVAVGNPIQSTAGFGLFVLWLAGARFTFTVLAWLVVCAVVGAGHHVVIGLGGPPTLVWLAAWREGWRIRRRWPADWAAAAAKTTRVQAEVGTSKEPVASARLRPVADHPKLSWWPRIEWPVVSWWVGPPPGRSFRAFDEMTSVLTANISHCADVAVDYDRAEASWGRLVVTFTDPLSTGRPTTWTPPASTGFEPAVPVLELPSHEQAAGGGVVVPWPTLDGGGSDAA